MGRRALVLGGGGITAIAWEFGLLYGLSKGGVHLSDADEVIGTSAGSVVGAHLLTHPIEDVETGYAKLSHPELGGAFSLPGMAMSFPQVAMATSHLDRRRRIGRAAIRAHPSGGHARVELLRRHMDIDAWPDKSELRITAMNAESGRIELFDRNSGVDIVRVIAASCAVPFVWPAVIINDEPHFDGGIRSPTNADLVTDAVAVLALVPLQLPLARHHSIRAELERGGSERHMAIEPDVDARKAIGRGLLDPRRAEQSAKAGIAQGLRYAERVRNLWHG